MYCSAVLSAWDPAHASQGLVGAALVATNKDGSNDEEVTHTEVSVQYRGLVPLGPRVTVARAAGNVVLELDASSADATVPTAVLLKQLAARVGTRSKDGAVYAAVYEPDSNHTDGPTVVVEISAGDPSRGSLALATQWQQADVWSLAPGTGIRFFEAGTSMILQALRIY
ncbi:hypothetical protein BC828DRAFT_129681 [Blastocladiella britannica]|nr:hypothetical protein BC828DRAFT_129681 [Blastocladiella britannica]